MSLSQTPFIMSPILSESTPSEYLASTGTTGNCKKLPIFFVAINVPTIKKRRRSRVQGSPFRVTFLSLTLLVG